MQAVMRKREGMEPRKTINRDGPRGRLRGSHHGERRYGEALPASPGSETMACMTSRSGGNPGDPGALFRLSLESMLDNPQKEGQQTCVRESDHPIVLMTAGNAARGKGVTG
jgi:hypothetical protein